MPIWAFHGELDGIVPARGSSHPISVLRECAEPPAADARITVYPDVAHDAWTRTYDLSAGHDIYSWLLTQSN